MKKSTGNIIKSKKFRYGGTAVAFTVAFVAFIIIINVIFTSLATKYRWYIDMTGDEVYTLSDATKNVLKDVTDEVTIIFCRDKDKIDADPSMFYIHNTAQNLAAEFDNIKIEYRDALTNYRYLKQFTTVSSPYVKDTSVIVKSGTEYRKYEFQRFFISDTEDKSYIWAYQGENVFASAILQVTADEMPIAYFTKEHGEDLTDDATAFIELIRDAGYDIQAIDLSKEEIDPACRLLVINNPKYDFGGIKEEHIGKSEIEKIDEFLDGRGTMMVFVSPENVGNLPNLSEFLWEWGVEFNPNVTVNDPGNSVSDDGYSVVGQYNTREDKLASSIYKEITSMSSQPKAIFRQATPISHTWKTDEYTTSDLSVRNISDVFVTSSSALLNENGVLGETEKQYSLMTITQEYKIINNEEYTSYVVVGGSANFITAEYLQSYVYTNRDVIHSLLIALEKKNVPAGIDFKVFEKYDLDITTAQADSWTRVLILVMPICTVAACIVVTVRRKYR